MNIVYVAYCCAPYNGSEASIGWEIPLNASRNNKVFLVTVPESKPFIDRYYAETMGGGQASSKLIIKYVDIPKKYKDIFRGPLYTFRLNIWHQEAARLIGEICRENSIDVIHQITPVEFRSIGPYDRIKGVKFICGPVGGGEYAPAPLNDYLQGHFKTEYIRKVANQISGALLNKRKLNILFANEETKKLVRPNSDAKCVTEIGISPNMFLDNAVRKDSYTNKTINFLVAGRLLYRKGHLLLIDALKLLPKNADYICKIIGDGPCYSEIEESIKELGNNVILKNAVSYTEMKREYAEADVLIMPSLRETTGTVLLEALANGVPVITVDKFGGHTLLDESVSWFYDGNTKDEYIRNLSTVIYNCIENRSEVLRKAENTVKYAKRYTWDKKVEQYIEIYRELIGDQNDSNKERFKGIS